MTRFVPFRTPFHDMAVLQNRLNSIFHDFGSTSSSENESFRTGSFVPAVDIFEDGQNVKLKLEIPGVQQSDLDIHIEDNTLTVKGERKFDSTQKEENYHRIERRYGSFMRSFTLPPTVNPEGVTASYDAGVLSIAIAKRAEAKPRQVKIEVGSAQTPKQVEGSPEAKRVASATQANQPVNA